MPVSRISLSLLPSLHCKYSLRTSKFMSHVKNYFPAHKKKYDRIGIKTLMAKNSRHCDGENDDDDGGKNYGTSH